MCIYLMFIWCALNSTTASNSVDFLLYCVSFGEACRANGACFHCWHELFKRKSSYLSKLYSQVIWQSKYVFKFNLLEETEKFTSQNQKRHVSLPNCWIKKKKKQKLQMRDLLRLVQQGRSCLCQLRSVARVALRRVFPREIPSF